MEMGNEKDNKSLTICCFLCSASGFTLIFIFSQLVFLFRNVCGEQHPRSRKFMRYLRNPSVTIFGFFGLKNEGRAGAGREEDQVNKVFLSARCSKTSHHNNWLKKILPAFALWRHPTSILVLGMSVIGNIWLACQSAPAFPDAGRRTRKAPSH